jgi:catechol 2,3-dioxygenase-like lactoylglutathione lyase family enzyme
VFSDTPAISGFAVPDTAQVRDFYGDTLGIRISADDEGILTLHLAGDRDTIIYPKPDHVPATYTILNFVVDDIDAAVDGLAARGVTFDHYDGFDQDEKGVMRNGPGPLVAWFKDPAGNILSVFQDA